MTNHLSAETISELVETLRYLKREFDQGFRIDATNMAHVEKALSRVDIETSFARQAEFAELTAADKATIPALSEMMRGMLFNRAAE